MLPFCGYNMGDYFAHWLEMGKRSDKMPRIYYVNWFRKDAQGKFLWPGFGENSRILKWIFERTSNIAPAQKTAIGYIPTTLDTSNLTVDLSQLLAVDVPAWKQEVAELTSYFKLFGDALPKPLLDELHSLSHKINSLP
jgi:phosphoenolpyruvate carboxykinase (GTP)